MPKYWMGTAPTVCDFNRLHPIGEKFIDGKTTNGPWANMCLNCARVNGVGLGMGRGQEYTKQADGRWLKTGG